MSDSVAEIIKRLAAADAEMRELRQLFMAEMRSVRAELKALALNTRDTGRAVDTLLAAIKEADEREDEATRG